MSETKTPYQTAVDWYKEEEIHRSIPFIALAWLLDKTNLFDE